MGDWDGAPQQLLASVTEGVQRLTKQLQPRKLEFKLPQATQTNASKRPVSHRAPVVGFKSHQVVVESEGVLTPLQVAALSWVDLFSCFCLGNCCRECIEVSFKELKLLGRCVTMSTGQRLCLALHSWASLDGLATS